MLQEARRTGYGLGGIAACAMGLGIFESESRLSRFSLAIMESKYDGLDATAGSATRETMGLGRVPRFGERASLIASAADEGSFPPSGRAMDISSSI